MNQKEKIEIFTAADGNFFIQAAVLIDSLISSQKNPFKLTVIGNEWSTKQKEKLLQKSKNIFELDFIELDLSFYKEVNLTSKYPLATIYNLLGPHLLFNTKKKIIYIDADTIVLESLEEVWGLKFNEPVAAVPDSNIAVIGNPSIWRPWLEEKSNPLSPYLNTGFMMINIDEWNRRKITEKCLDLLNRYSMPCIDQDAINLVLNGQFYIMHPKYNVMPYHFIPNKRFSDLIQNSNLVDEAVRNPVVIHFYRSILGKPWDVGSTHPARHYWRILAKKITYPWYRKFHWYDSLIPIVGKCLGMSKVSIPDSVKYYKKHWIK